MYVASYTRGDIAERGPKPVPSWRERLVFLGSIKSLIAECAVSSCEGLARENTEALVCPARDLELLLRAVGDLEEFRVGNNMVLFVDFETLWQTSKTGFIKL